MKSERAIPLGDCQTLVVAEQLRGTAVFGHREDDLARAIRRKPFPVKPVFLVAILGNKG